MNSAEFSKWSRRMAFELGVLCRHIRPASTSTRPPRCNDFQFERLKLSAGLRAYPPYCPHRFLCSGVPTSRIAHHVVGERFGASRNVVLPRFFLAHRLVRPLERSEIAWGCLWVRLGCARGQNQIAFNRDSRVFAVFSATRTDNNVGFTSVNAH